MRLTASSIRAIGISPASTCFVVLAMNAFQSSGTMTMSMPALIASAQLALLQPGSWPMAFQSETMKPSKPIFVFSASVSSVLSPCILP